VAYSFRSGELSLLSLISESGLLPYWLYCREEDFSETQNKGRDLMAPALVAQDLIPSRSTRKFPKRTSLQVARCSNLSHYLAEHCSRLFLAGSIPY
jgi:hypothetical protein